MITIFIIGYAYLYHVSSYMSSNLLIKYTSWSWILTTPRIINKTETNLEIVNLSATDNGKMAARMNVKRPEAEEITLTTPASVSLRVIW